MSKSGPVVCVCVCVCVCVILAVHLPSNFLVILEDLRDVAP